MNRKYFLNELYTYRSQKWVWGFDQNCSSRSCSLDSTVDNKLAGFCQSVKSRNLTFTTRNDK